VGPDTDTSLHSSLSEQATPAWAVNNLAVPDYIDRPQLQQWAYQTSNSEMTTAERFEKANWQRDCSRL
jgi:hypothetical protein